ncbi:MAG: flavin reductase [Bilifractor sp.]|jgi:flavin reductase (DIM6/NTAB) family NADH-FMN oxidoreductase RutF|nr:flavin reductase [Lachnospiraceae bacterium]
MIDMAMRKLSYGLFVCTAKEGDRDNGCIINTALQVASAPNTIAIALNKTDFTHDMILHTGEFNVSILSEASTFDIYQRFGYQSGRDTDKMTGIEFRRAENGITYITTPDVNAYLSGKVRQTVDLGSHTLFIADVTGGEVLNDTASATYAYYFAHIKPAPAPKKDDAPKKGWICTICGYIYEGEVLPPDFICPICKHPASDFRKL